MTAHPWWGEDPSWWGGGGWIWGLIGGVLMLAFWVVVVVVIVGLVRGRGVRASGSATGALRVLEERYARGEIDRDEFIERRRVLSGTPSDGTASSE